MKEEDYTPLHRLIVKAPEGIWLAGVTGLGYFSAYLGELGYKSHFRIPSMFVEITLNGLVLAVCIIIAALLITYLTVAVPYFSKYGKYLFPVLIPLSVGLIIGLKLGFVFNWSQNWMMVLLLFFHMVLLWVFFRYAKKPEEGRV
ncbi:hypothetical protein GCM10011571_22380 [Marinithermofilum abyssi]|uniref:Uncharacterized protein n=1 Tax=Marinithermofilum abyssi TaxID=1571185 RepID=A0A8J2VIF6_9BACL|nr:hypothetical protein [Marinithermofilum abyssi]GGE19946.1 hypothetical protein GCM10011571_22380 [Marinithermofilum abyssi]